MKTMKALVKAQPDRGLSLQDVPVPEIGITMLVKSTEPICGTDVQYLQVGAWAQKIPVPWWSATNSSARSSGRSDVTTFIRAKVSGDTLFVSMPELSGGPTALCKSFKGAGVNRPVRLPFLSLPMTNVWYQRDDNDRDVASIYDPFGNASIRLTFPCSG